MLCDTALGPSSLGFSVRLDDLRLAGRGIGISEGLYVFVSNDSVLLIHFVQ